MINVINTVDDWKAFRPEWDELYAKCGIATPFQAFAFQLSSWTNMVKDGELHIITIIKDSDNAILAIFPTYIDRRGILRFINGRHIDFCSALILPDYEKDYHLYEVLVDYILAESKIKGYDFDNLKEDNYLSSVLCYLCKGSLVSITNHWSYLRIGQFNVKKTLVEILSNLNGRDRYRLKRLSNRTTNFKFISYDINCSTFPFAIVNEIVSFMIDKGLRTEAYFSRAFMNVIEDSYNAGLLILGVSFRGNEPVSCNICMRRKKEFINWISIYKNHSETTLNLLQNMTDIYYADGGVFNFARGIYEYKIRNFKPEIHNLYRIRYTKYSIRRFFVWIDVCIYYLKQVVKSIIRK